jgi:hypothetical protein
LFACCALGQPQPPSPTARKTAQENQDQATPKAAEQESNERPITINIPGGTEIRIGEKKEARNGDEKQSSTDWWALPNTVLVTTFTGFLAWLAHRQRQAMTEQAGYMRDGLAETKRSADAAWLSAEALINSERAWVKVVDIINPSDVPSGFMFKFKNGGKTAAKLTGLVAKGEALLNHQSLPETPNYDGATHHPFTDKPGYETILIPEEHTGSLLNIPIPEGFATQAIRLGAIQVYAYGLLTYRDSFNRERKLQFGYIWIPGNLAVGLGYNLPPQWAQITLKEYNYHA